MKGHHLLLEDGQLPSKHAPDDAPPFSPAEVGQKSRATDEAQHQLCLAECVSSLRGLKWAEQLNNSAGQHIGSHPREPAEREMSPSKHP